jgi:hypothetical protein
MAIQIGNQGTITISTRITVDSAKQSYAFNVYTNGGVCSDSFPATVYALTPNVDIGTAIYDDISLTIPTSYTAISDPLNPGGGYYILTAGTITSSAGCN